MHALITLQEEPDDAAGATENENVNKIPLSGQAEDENKIKLKRKSSNVWPFQYSEFAKYTIKYSLGMDGYFLVTV